MQSGGPLLTTCSIAYGKFKYENRIGLRQVRKNFILGEAYLNAFFGSETDSPKLEPGQCRLLKDGLTFLSDLPENPIFSLLKPKGDYYYFYWMLLKLNGLKNYEKKYQEISQSVYPKLIQLI